MLWRLWDLGSWSFIYFFNPKAFFMCESHLGLQFCSSCLFVYTWADRRFSHFYFTQCWFYIRQILLLYSLLKLSKLHLYDHKLSNLWNYKICPLIPFFLPSLVMFPNFPYKDFVCLLLLIFRYLKFLLQLWMKFIFPSHFWIKFYVNHLMSSNVEFSQFLKIYWWVLLYIPHRQSYYYE